MNKIELAKSLVKLAKQIDADTKKQAAIEEYRTNLGKELVAAMEGRNYLTIEEVGVICPPCAERMAAKKISRIKKSAIINAKMTWEECIADAKKTGKKDPEKFCGWLYWHGPNAGKHGK
jgi:hypothetical protein